MTVLASSPDCRTACRVAMMNNPRTGRNIALGGVLTDKTPRPLQWSCSQFRSEQLR